MGKISINFPTYPFQNGGQAAANSSQQAEGQPLKTPQREGYSTAGLFHIKN